MEGSVEDKILKFCYEMKPKNILTVGNDDSTFIEELFNLCDKNEIVITVGNPSETINIDNYNDEYDFEFIKFNNFDKFLMLNRNDVILINGNFHFDDLYDELINIINQYSPKTFPFIIFYNTLNYFQDVNIPDNLYTKLNTMYNNENSEQLKNFVIDTDEDLYFYSTFLLNGLYILCSNTKYNKKLIQKNFSYFEISEENINSFICFETKFIDKPFSYETLFIKTQNSDFPVSENIDDIVQREVVLTETKNELYSELVQKEKIIDELNCKIDDVVQREVVLTETKNDLYDNFVQKEKLIVELNDVINKLHNDIVKNDKVIDNLKKELQVLSNNEKNMLKDNTELQNALIKNKKLINELKEVQEELNNSLIQKDDVINDLSSKLVDVNEKDVSIKQFKWDLAEKDKSIERLEKVNKEIQDSLIQKDDVINDLTSKLGVVNKKELAIRQELVEKNKFIKKLELCNKRIQNQLVYNQQTCASLKEINNSLKEINESYESSTSWKVTSPFRQFKKFFK